MSEITKDINVIELLMGIKSDVSSIKTDIANFKESQKSERDTILKEIADVRVDTQRDISDLENRLMARINTMQSVQSTLVGEVDTLKHAEDKKDAKKWKTLVAFILTGVGGLLLGLLPDFITFLLRVRGR